MKRIFPIAMLPIMAATIMSCSDDLPEAEPAYVTAIHAEKKSLAAGGTSHSLSAIGLAHNLLLDDYLSRNMPPPATLADIDATVAVVMQANGFAVPGCGGSSCTVLVAGIISDPMSFHKSTIAESGLSYIAATYLTQFLQDFSLPAQGAEAQLELVRDALSDIADSPEFTAFDRDVLLTTMSIAEASVLYGKERKDKDWETSVGNIVAASRGALGQPELALRLSLLAGIMQHHNLQAH